LKDRGIPKRKRSAFDAVECHESASQYAPPPEPDLTVKQRLRCFTVQSDTATSSEV
jgi:hypothetical protein